MTRDFGTRDPRNLDNLVIVIVIVIVITPTSYLIAYLSQFTTFLIDSSTASIIL